MTALEFLSARPARTRTFRPRLSSPLARALRSVPLGIRLSDLSLALAKYEVRGDLDAIVGHDLIRITPTRGLVLGPYEQRAALEQALRGQVATVIDVTGALAGLRIQAADAANLIRRLTDLNLDSLPAVGAIARVPGVLRGGGETFELYWAQEYGHYLAEVVIDTAEGLGKRRLRA